jgi:hypothetical protein
MRQVEQRRHIHASPPFLIAAYHCQPQLLHQQHVCFTEGWVVQLRRLSQARQQRL